MPRNMLIRVRRGKEDQLTGTTLMTGELAFTTDTQKLFIGSDSGNILLSNGGSLGDMLKLEYDKDNDGKVDVAKIADTVNWQGIINKPLSFVPSAHKSTHSLGGVDAISPSDIGAMPKGPVTWDQLKGSVGVE